MTRGPETNPPVVNASSPVTDGTSLDNTATILVGGFTALAAALTAFGAVSGGLTRMLRNYPGLSLTAAILISLAIGFGIAAKTAISGGKTRLAQKLIILGVLSFVGGLGFATGAATQAPSGLERPEITARLSYEDGLTLVGEVKASDLRWTDFVEVTVLAAKLTVDKPGEIDWRSQHFLYVSHTGPDTDGKVDITFHVPIRVEESWNVLQVTGVIAQRPTGFPNCVPNAPASLACMAIRLPIPHRPQVVATWSTTGGHPTLTVTTKAYDLPATEEMQTTVVTRSSKRTTVISQAVISPDNRGSVVHSEVLPVARGSNIVCVIAERRSSGTGKVSLPVAPNKCPASTDKSVTEMLTVPDRASS
jgi:hypothetical protein